MKHHPFPTLSNGSVEALGAQVSPDSLIWWLGLLPGN